MFPPLLVLCGLLQKKKQPQKKQPQKQEKANTWRDCTVIIM
jgi:hypothetical protein